MPNAGLKEVTKSASQRGKSLLPSIPSGRESVTDGLEAVRPPKKNVRFRFSGHQSFALRLAWIPKAIAEIQKGFDPFADIDHGIEAMGLGKNMVESLRCWLESAQIIHRKAEGEPWSLTKIGELVFDPATGRDRFLEDHSTSWVIHWLLCTNQNQPLYAWECLFNRWTAPEFCGSEATEAFQREYLRGGKEASAITLKQHWEVFLHSYRPPAAAKGEDHLDCVLSSLGLIREVGERQNKGGRWEPLYAFEFRSKPGIPQQLFSFFLQDWWNLKFPAEHTVRLHDLVAGDMSPGRLLKMQEKELMLRLELLCSKVKSPSFEIIESANSRHLRRLRADSGLRDLTAAYDKPEFPMTRLKHSTSVTPVPISEALRIHPRFMRSVQLERDIDDAESSKGYILTPMAADAMKRITSSFRPDTTQRAWRIAGDYGSGKTDFALALSRIAMGLKEELPRPLGKFVGPLLKPAMATGDRESLARTILRAIGNPWAASSEPTTEDVIEAVRGAVVKAKRQQYEGLLLIVDELGKNLEFAASHPERDDVFLLQRLAEEASRSRTKALVFVVMLHQGVASYAQGLDTLSRREWDKVAGRFEEIVFAQPIEQVTALVAATLDVRLELLPMSTKIMSRSDMEKAIGLGFFGNSASNGLIEHGATVYPFHPTVIPVLLRTMRRFGQNERSLFSFMSSNEALGLQDFARRDVESGDHYRISNLFDYLRTSLLPNLTSGSAQTHWGVIDAVLASTLVEDETENAVMKTTALLTLLDAPDLPATKEVVQLAVGGPRAAVNRAISNLQARGVFVRAWLDQRPLPVAAHQRQPG